MSFTNYTPQINWQGHDKGHKQSANGAKGAAMKSAAMTLPGSLHVAGKPALMDIPNRDSISTDKTLQRDRTDMIKRGGR